MANLGCLFVCRLDDCLAPVLVAVHMMNNLDLSDEQGHKNEDHESECP